MHWYAGIHSWHDVVSLAISQVTLFGSADCSSGGARRSFAPSASALSIQFDLAAQLTVVTSRRLSPWLALSFFNSISQRCLYRPFTSSWNLYSWEQEQVLRFRRSYDHGNEKPCENEIESIESKKVKNARQLKQNEERGSISNRLKL